MNPVFKTSSSSANFSSAISDVDVGVVSQKPGGGHIWEG